MSRHAFECPLCGAEPRGTGRVANYVDVEEYDCRRCGRFRVAGTALLTGAFTPELRPYLSAYTRQSTEQGLLPEILHNENAQELARPFQATTPSQKLDRLLTVLIERSGHVGAPAEFSPEWDYPLLDAENPDEAGYHLNALMKRGLVEPRGGDLVIVTHEGWDRSTHQAAFAAPATPERPPDESRWDVFICHAGEDKQDVVEPLAEALRKLGLEVWYDRFILTIGDSLRRKIDDGLANSRFGVVVLSRAFFGKGWPERELDGLVEREIDGRKVILPVWHGITRSDVVAYSPPLADRLAGSTHGGIKSLADELYRAIAGTAR